MKKLPAILMASAMTIGSVVPAFAVTPPLNIKGFTIPDISGSVKVPDVVIPDTNNKDTDKKDDKEDSKKDDKKDDSTDQSNKKDEATYEKFNAWVKSFMNYDKFCMPIGK